MTGRSKWWRFSSPQWGNVPSALSAHDGVPSGHLVTHRHHHGVVVGRWEVPTMFIAVGGKTSPPAAKRSVVGPFSLWRPNCALHREHVGPIGLTYSGCTTTSGSAQLGAISSEQTTRPRWPRRGAHRREHVGRPDSIVLGVLYNTYNAPGDGRAHPRNTRGTMGPSLCSPSGAY